MMDTEDGHKKNELRTIFGHALELLSRIDELEGEAETETSSLMKAAEELKSMVETQSEESEEDIGEYRILRLRAKATILDYKVTDLEQRVRQGTGTLEGAADLDRLEEKLTDIKNEVKKAAEKAAELAIHQLERLTTDLPNLLASQDWQVITSR